MRKRRLRRVNAVVVRLKNNGLRERERKRKRERERERERENKKSHLYIESDVLQEPSLLFLPKC